MRLSELELKVIDILRRVETGVPLEDVRQECKTAWPPSNERTARQLAGHANAARGEPILWLFGVDEKGSTVSGVPNTEFSDWHSQLKKYFDESWAPDVELHINVPWKDVRVVAVLFETNRAPYVIKNPQQAQIQFEVPWREGNSTFTARRRDLLRLLVPLQRMPQVELLSAALEARKRGKGQHGDWSIRFNLDLGLYILTRDSGRITIPGHRSSFSIGLATTSKSIYHRKVEFPRSSSLTKETGEQLGIDRPGYFSCRCELSTDEVPIEEGCGTEISLHLHIAELERDIDLKAPLTWAPDREEYRRDHPEYLGSWQHTQATELIQPIAGR